MTLNLPSLLWTIYADLYFSLYKSITSIFIAEAARFELAEPLWFATLAKWWYKPLTQTSKIGKKEEPLYNVLFLNGFIQLTNWQILAWPKHNYVEVSVSMLLRGRDSNPVSSLQVMSLACYHYTTSLYIKKNQPFTKDSNLYLFVKQCYHYTTKGHDHSQECLYKIPS